MKKIIVAGTRTFNNYQVLRYILDTFIDALEDTDIEIVSGGARGADTLGEKYAAEHSLPLKIFPAKWDQYGKRAGYLRNAQMADYADILVAFWDGKSKGTQHMISLAENKGLDVYCFNY